MEQKGTKKIRKYCKICNWGGVKINYCIFSMQKKPKYKCKNVKFAQILTSTGKRPQKKQTRRLSNRAKEQI